MKTIRKRIKNAPQNMDFRKYFIEYTSRKEDNILWIFAALVIKTVCPKSVTLDDIRFIWLKRRPNPTKPKNLDDDDVRCAVHELAEKKIPDEKITLRRDKHRNIVTITIQSIICHFYFRRTGLVEIAISANQECVERYTGIINDFLDNARLKTIHQYQLKLCQEFS